MRHQIPHRQICSTFGWLTLHAPKIINSARTGVSLCITKCMELAEAQLPPTHARVFNTTPLHFSVSLPYGDGRLDAPIEVIRKLLPLSGAARWADQAQRGMIGDTQTPIKTCLWFNIRVSSSCPPQNREYIVYQSPQRRKRGRCRRFHNRRGFAKLTCDR